MTTVYIIDDDWTVLDASVDKPARRAVRVDMTDVDLRAYRKAVAQFQSWQDRLGTLQESGTRVRYRWDETGENLIDDVG